MNSGNIELCERCEKKEAQSEHMCPFKFEIYDDKEYKCNCCSECELECAMDV